MRMIDILNEKVNETLEDGFKFKYNGNVYTYDKITGFINDNDGKGIGDAYCVENILNDEVEVIEEEEIEEIDELRIAGITTKEMENIIKLKDVLNDTLYDIKEKTNELVRAVNKLNKGKEEK